MAKDAYQTLGLTPDADKESIKLAYYAFRRQFAALKKPTRAQTERLVRINTAWDGHTRPPPGQSNRLLLFKVSRLRPVSPQAQAIYADGAARRKQRSTGESHSRSRRRSPGAAGDLRVKNGHTRDENLRRIWADN